MLNRALVAVTCCGLLGMISGCQTNGTLTPEQKASLKTPDETFAKYDIDAAQLRESLNNKTVLFHGTGHGTQVAYYSAEGKEYLWYPFNKRVVVGEWKTENAPKAKLKARTTQGQRSRSIKTAKVCFLYNKGSYNPVTGRTGGKWECTLSTRWLQQVQERADGDIFNLSSGKVPFRLNKRKTTIEELKGQCKICKMAAK